MSSPTSKHLFVLGFPDRAGADAAVTELKELSRDMFLQVKDYAIITKDAEGKLTVEENPDADHGPGVGGVAGGFGGALLAIASGPIGLGAVVVGAGVGAVASALRDTGFKNDDMKSVGQLMEGGRTILLVVLRPEDTERLQGVLDDIPEFKAADRRWEVEVGADSKNVLRDAIAKFEADKAAGQAG